MEKKNLLRTLGTYYQELISGILVPGEEILAFQSGRWAAFGSSSGTGPDLEDNSLQISGQTVEMLALKMSSAALTLFRRSRMHRTQR